MSCHQAHTFVEHKRRPRQTSDRNFQAWHSRTAGQRGRQRYKKGIITWEIAVIQLGKLRSGIHHDQFLRVGDRSVNILELIDGETGLA